MPSGIENLDVEQSEGSTPDKTIVNDAVHTLTWAVPWLRLPDLRFFDRDLRGHDSIEQGPRLKSCCASRFHEYYQVPP